MRRLTVCLLAPPVQLPMSQKGLSKFHALRPPAISIKDYLQRVAKYAACSGECFVLALVYIDRIIQSNPTFVVNSLNIHRLLITSIMLAAKFFDDQYFNNAYYAKVRDETSGIGQRRGCNLRFAHLCCFLLCSFADQVGGVPCNEINSLEVEFLFMWYDTKKTSGEQQRLALDTRSPFFLCSAFSPSSATSLCS